MPSNYLGVKINRLNIWNFGIIFLYLHSKEMDEYSTKCEYIIANN